MSIDTLKFCGTPAFETERLVCRTLTLDDAGDVFNYARQAEVARYVAWDAHKSIDDSINFINWTINRIDRDESGDWGLEYKDTGRIIGAMGFVSYDAQNFCSGIGYVLSKEYWGKGLMTEAVKKLIRFGFEEMGLNRIEAVHIPQNEASGRVMVKCGMKYEGLLRQRMFAKDRFWDVQQYAILKDDWLTLPG